MNKFLRTAPITLALVLLATPLFAAEGGTSISFSGAFGAGLVVIGACLRHRKIGLRRPGKHGPSAKHCHQRSDHDDHRRRVD